MVKHSLIALFIAALPVAFWGGTDLADARDSSSCPRSDPPTTTADTPVKECVDPLSQATAAEEQPQPAQKDPAASSVIPGPIARLERFAYSIRYPEKPSGETIILLHGSGGDETSMFKLASRIAPHATLLGVRGRIVQKGIKRWYARVSPTEFDQDDIRKEAQAFVDFLKERMAAEKLDLDRATFIGYSNGANLIAATTLLHPGLIHRAVLLRAMPVLSAAPEVDLHRSRFLTVAGKMDKVYGPFAPALEALLRERGATVDSYAIQTGHLLGDEDVKVVSDWLSASNAMITETSR